ncbi:hypothetical protein AAHZ94_34190, partial [Streptomyces sp. HSW2009]
MDGQGRVTMTDGARLWWTVRGDVGRQPPVVLLHGGPGLPDYLGGGGAPGGPPPAPPPGPPPPPPPPAP